MDWDLVGKSGWDRNRVKIEVCSDLILLLTRQKSGFNLTASYRRDSDVTRIWGSGQNTIDLLRWDKKNEKIISYEDHINEIMSRKSKERLSSK